MLGAMPSRAVLLRSIAGLLLAAACAAPPQADSTALAEPEPRPTEDPASEFPAAAEAVPVDEAPTSPEPPASSEPPASPEPPAASITGIAICDEYLSLYQRCEAHLQPEIMAGERRFYRSEAASLQHLAGTPEAAGLPEACRSWLEQLRVDCPAQHRAGAPAGRAAPG